MANDPIRILLIEDDPDYVDIIKLNLTEREPTDLPFAVRSRRPPRRGPRPIDSNRYDAVLVDLGLPDAVGLEAVSSVLKAFSRHRGPGLDEFRRRSRRA